MTSNWRSNDEEGKILSDALALADLISEFVFGGLNAYGQPSTANKLLLDAVVLLHKMGEVANVISAQ